jgi:uncharacterized repeat protein (TIGR04076 family)
MGKDLKIAVIEIKGTCPVYQKGDSFLLKNGYILDPGHSCRICMHSLASILPYYVALSHDVAPPTIGLNKKDENGAFLQCLDPCAYTAGGTVIFEVEIMK